MKYPSKAYRVATFAAVLLGGLACGGCVSPMATIAGMEVTITDQRGEDLDRGGHVLPGSLGKLTATVTGVTKDGEPVRRGITRWNDYMVTATGAVFDPRTGSVLFSDDKAALPKRAYVITLVHAPSGFRLVKRYVADFARIYGPEPEDVISFEVYLMQGDTAIRPGKPLIPGERYWVRTAAIDRANRTFATRDADYPIPSTRVTIATAGFAGLEDFGLLADTDAAVGSESYYVSAAYQGGKWEDQITFAYDPAIVQGPSPEDVTDVAIVGPLGERNSIGPGAAVDLDVRVSDGSGRSWRLGAARGSHALDEYPLPTGRVEVTTDNASWDAPQRRIYFRGDAHGMVGRRYGVTVKYDGRSGLEDSRVFEPDFLAIVPLMESDEIVYKGEDGYTGSSGYDGRSGKDADDDGWARSGSDGDDGRIGSHGQHGPDIRVVAHTATTLDGGHRLVVFEVSSEGSRGQYFVRPLDGAPVSIVSIGGKGGNGGAGGQGGRGGDGYSRYRRDGADGGDGGHGADGGQGGDGGMVTLVVSSRDLANAFILDGRGGSGGSGGPPGERGYGGSAGVWKNDEGERRSGDRGSSGQRGNPGMRGRNGRAGRTTVNIQLGTEAVLSRLPEHIRSTVLRGQ